MSINHYQKKNFKGRSTSKISSFARNQNKKKTELNSIYFFPTKLTKFFVKLISSMKEWSEWEFYSPLEGNL